LIPEATYNSTYVLPVYVVFLMVPVVLIFHDEFVLSPQFPPKEWAMVLGTCFPHQCLFCQDTLVGLRKWVGELVSPLTHHTDFQPSLHSEIPSARGGNKGEGGFSRLYSLIIAIIYPK
jgi:hypothetical protein